MATETRLTLFAGADHTVRVDVKTEDGGATPQAMTGWALAFVLRRSSDASLVVNKATGGSGITIGDGDGTNDRATISIADTDTLGWPAGRGYEWALWRTDAGSDIPMAYGTAEIKRPAAQP